MGLVVKCRTLLKGLTTFLIIICFLPLTEVDTNKASYLKCSNPVVVAEMSGTQTSLGWGYFQFPRLSFNPDGDIVCKIAYKKDSASSYNGDYLYYISSDKGESWHQATEPQIDCSLMMDNGRYYQGAKLENSYDSGIEKKYTPKFVSKEKEITLFLGDEVSEEDYSQCFECEEYDPSTRLINPFTASYEWPYFPIWTRNGLTYAPGKPFYPFSMHTPGMIAKEEDGSLFAAVACVGFDSETGEVPQNGFRNVYCFRSKDCARTWKYVSQILTKAEYCKTSKDGFCEPNIIITPDGTYFMIMRTGSYSPSYCTWSQDKGQTWNDISVFAECGVDPQILRLKCGTTIASFGRPGVYAKTSNDGCREWSGRVKIDESGLDRGDGSEIGTCGYSSMVPLDDDTALIAFSQFYYPEGKEGEAMMKKIIVRRLSATNCS